MLPLSVTVGHVSCLLRCVDEPGGQRIPVESVAEGTGSSKAYLGKIVPRLARLGPVDSQRGHHGGVVLARLVVRSPGTGDGCHRRNSPALALPPRAAGLPRRDLLRPPQLLEADQARDPRPAPRGDRGKHASPPRSGRGTRPRLEKPSRRPRHGWRCGSGQGLPPPRCP